MLTHYTRSPEAVANILNYGFAWMPNRRKLATLLIPQHDYSRREPQQFGMVSFTELEPAHARAHCEIFGYYGIVVSDTWAIQHGAQRVIYVDDTGPVTVALQELFNVGYIDVTRRIRFPDDAGWQMCYENKNAALMMAGSTLWAYLLQVWEYLEPASSAAQREWRIVNPDPNYGLSENKAEAIARVSPPRKWANLNVVASDVIALVSRAKDVEALQSCLPGDYQDMPIKKTDG
jgi:hypothetical protein